MRAFNAGERGAPWCSFCGKSHREVFHIISGPSCWICDECIELCQEIVREKRNEAVKTREASDAI